MKLLAVTLAHVPSHDCALIMHMLVGLSTQTINNDIRNQQRCARNFKLIALKALTTFFILNNTAYLLAACAFSSDDK